MSLVRIKSDNVPIHMWASVDEVETLTLRQLKNIASLPWCFSHVAVMPDVHLGKGATVGSVVAMKGAVAPAAVGVDIGCGMAAVRTSLNARELPDSLGKLRASIEQAIPVGFNAHAQPAFETASDALKQQSVELLSTFGQLTADVQDLSGRAAIQLGTLGGGNHFIELCLDTEDRVWLMLHSGSRNIGKSLAEIHIARARKLAHNHDLPDRDLSVFLAGTPEMDEYRRDLFWAQRYAKLNRDLMLELYVRTLQEWFPHMSCEESISCHHNYVAEETHSGEEVLVTRKGAIRAGLGEMGIIPGSMGARSFIVRGLGNKESFCSASHGAGRKMSRAAAKRKYTLRDLERQTEGIECRKDKDVIDEIPAAYKDIRRVMEHQKDLVEVVAELHQVLCCKG
jgi:tRNA-splicing ligase RtcB (3'-phosphate/5'-hydroxy nucleic acid ligase)